MRHDHHYHNDPVVETYLRSIERHLGLILEGMKHMATKEQLDKLRVDVAALIDEAVKDITEAVKEAQEAPPEQADQAIDDLDKTVTDTTTALKTAASKLRNPPA